MQDVIRQSANAASFMVGLIRADFDLIGRSVNDLLAEPRRTQLIPGFEEAKRSALGNGAIGFGISGSGPSVFALCRGEHIAKGLADVISDAFSVAGLGSEAIVSSLNSPGAYIL
jgi:homoserine kinase